MKKDKITVKEDAFLKEVFDHGGVEMPPVGLADRIMANIEVLPKPKVEEPLLPLGFKIFFGIFFSVVLFMGIFYGVYVYDPATTTDSSIVNMDSQEMVNVLRSMSNFFARPVLLIGAVAIFLLVFLDEKLRSYIKRQRI